MAYNNLRIGNRTAEEFRAAWIEARNDLKEVGLLNTNPLSTYHEFFGKLPEDLMMRCVKDKRKYPLLDGGESEERAPKTWEEACDLLDELKERDKRFEYLPRRGLTLGLQRSRSKGRGHLRSQGQYLHLSRRCWPRLEAEGGLQHDRGWDLPLSSRASLDIAKEG